jgi:hypothetical protein
MRFNPNNFNIWCGDNKQLIEKCLNCDKNKCTNCLEYISDKKKRSYKRAGILQIEADTGKIVGRFQTIKEATIKTGASTKTIYEVLNGEKQSARGYIWKRKNEYEGAL